MQSLLFVLTLFAFLSSVSAHGYVSQIVNGGKTYAGLSPWEKPKSSIIRQISTTNPITNVDGKEMTCGWNAKMASEQATVKAGSTLTFSWRAATSKTWGHSIGPIMTYIAKCDGSCTNFDPANAKFIKVSQTGLKSDKRTWYQADIKAGKSYTMTLAKNIPNGNYIVRHELIALHFANKKGGAQFYPSCSQITITGGTGSSLPSTTVKFPGAYHDTDPGIFVPKIYNGPISNYVFPGGPVANFNSSGSNLAVTTAHATTSHTTTSHKSTATPPPSNDDVDDGDCTDDDPEEDLTPPKSTSTVLVYVTVTEYVKRGEPTPHPAHRRRSGGMVKRLPKEAGSD